MLQQVRFSAYRIMWLFVMFDLPVETKTDRKIAANFRKSLLKNGFSMYQYSIYIKHVPSAESADVFTKRVEANRPPKGEIGILKVTDKQFGDIITVRGSGKKGRNLPNGAQLEMF